MNDIEYNRLWKRSYGVLKVRIAIATKLILEGETNNRAFDNCFEMNDGDEVVSALIDLAMRDANFRGKLASLFPAQSLDSNGLPESWVETHKRTNNPLGLAA